jgi:diguanylate cyclase (GGDEF)-like protein
MATVDDVRPGCWPHPGELREVIVTHPTRDRALLALVAVTLVATTWLVADLGGLAAQTWVVWIALGAVHVVLLRAAVLVLHRTKGCAAARRLWWSIAAAAALFLAGDAAQVVAMIPVADRPEHLTGTAVQNTLVALGLALVILAALLEPMWNGTRTALAQFWLDVGVVVAAIAAVAGFAFTGVQGTPGHIVVAILVGPGIFGVVAFAVLKLASSPQPPFTGAAGYLAVAATVAETAIQFIASPLVSSGQARWLYVTTLVANALFAAGVGWQVHQPVPSTAPTPRAPGSGTSGAVLSFVAPLAVNALLVYALATEGLTTRTWVVLVAAVAGMALVVTRQLVALREKTVLLRDLDLKVTELHDTLAERDALSSRLQRLAFQDSLTGLANRAAFDADLAAALARPRRGQQGPLTVLLVDLDGFKQVNDAHGHGVGDALLVAAAERLRACARQGDLVVRLGGDEFCFLARASARGAQALAARVVRSLGEQFELDGVPVRIGASVGVAARREDDASGADLMRRADAAMYRAKRLGKGRYVVDDPEAHEVPGPHGPVDEDPRDLTA